MRVSNIIGLPVKNPRKLHKTFIDIFYENACKGIVYENYNSYKDFISVNQFSKIIISLVKFKAYGIYNVSLGKKVYLNNIVNWLNFYNSRNVVRIDSINSFNNDNFTLNNKKLKNKINFDNSLLTLKKECLSLINKFLNMKKKCFNFWYNGSGWILFSRIFIKKIYSSWS